MNIKISNASHDFKVPTQDPRVYLFSDVNRKLFI